MLQFPAKPDDIVPNLFGRFGRGGSCEGALKDLRELLEAFMGVQMSDF